MKTLLILLLLGSTADALNIKTTVIPAVPAKNEFSTDISSSLRGKYSNDHFYFIYHLDDDYYFSAGNFSFDRKTAINIRNFIDYVLERTK